MDRIRKLPCRRKLKLCTLKGDIRQDVCFIKNFQILGNVCLQTLCSLVELYKHYITSKSCCFGLRNAISCSRKWLFSFSIISKSLPYRHLPPLAFHQLIGCKLPYNAVGNLLAHKNTWSTVFMIQEGKYPELIIHFGVLDLRSHYANSLFHFLFFFHFCLGLSLYCNFQKCLDASFSELIFLIHLF